MTQPGMTSARGEDWLVRKVQELEQKVQQLAAANVFGLTGITPEDGGTSFDGYVNVNGPMTVNGAQTVNGDSNFKGNMTVSGTLTLPAGIIGNDALASPITIAQASNSAIAFPITTTDTPMATITISVPSGFSQAYIFAVCNVGALSTMTAGDHLYSSTIIQGATSREVKTGGGTDGGNLAVTTAKSSVLTGLSGGTISVGVNVRADTQRIASSDNRAYVEAQVIFLR